MTVKNLLFDVFNNQADFNLKAKEDQKPIDTIRNYKQWSRNNYTMLPLAIVVSLLKYPVFAAWGWTLMNDDALRTSYSQDTLSLLIINQTTQR